MMSQPMLSNKKVGKNIRKIGDPNQQGEIGNLRIMFNLVQFLKLKDSGGKLRGTV